MSRHSKIRQCLQIWILDSPLVIWSQLECPDIVFIQPVVHCNLVGIWRICKDTFSLNIIEVELLIIVFHGHDSSFSSYLIPFWLEFLQSLPIIIINHIFIIDIIQEMWVLFYRFMESSKWIIKNRLNNGPTGNVVEWDCDSLLYSHIRVFVFVRVLVGWSICSSQFYITYSN